MVNTFHLSVTTSQQLIRLQTKPLPQTFTGHFTPKLWSAETTPHDPIMVDSCDYTPIQSHSVQRWGVNLDGNQGL